MQLRTGRDLADLLRDLYVERGMSQTAIAAELGVARLTVAFWLAQHHIERPEPESVA